MKSFLLLIMSMMFFSCQSQKEIASKIATSIEEVYFERWMAGVRGGGAGINFHVRFKSPLSKTVQLQKVVFKGKEALFSKQDDLNYMAGITTKKGGRTDTEEETNEPLPESNEAKLYFIVNGKSAIHTLENVNEKEMFAYPVMNKNRE